MPSRTPVIPIGNPKLLKALHSEMRRYQFDLIAEDGDTFVATPVHSSSTSLHDEEDSPLTIVDDTVQVIKTDVDDDHALANSETESSHGEFLKTAAEIIADEKEICNDVAAHESAMVLPVIELQAESSSALYQVPNPLDTIIDGDDQLIFALEKAANGELDPMMSVVEAKNLENSMKQITKREKRIVNAAKLDLTEAQLKEAAAKLNVRKARVDEAHAKICRRLAVLKQAEDRLQLLEASLDQEEELLRQKEKQLAEREVRVKKEQAALRLRTESLSKMHSESESLRSDFEQTISKSLKDKQPSAQTESKSKEKEKSKEIVISSKKRHAKEKAVKGESSSKNNIPVKDEVVLKTEVPKSQSKSRRQKLREHAQQSDREVARPQKSSNSKRSSDRDTTHRRRDRIRSSDEERQYHTMDSRSHRRHREDDGESKHQRSRSKHESPRKHRNDRDGSKMSSTLPRDIKVRDKRDPEKKRTISQLSDDHMPSMWL